MAPKLKQFEQSPALALGAYPGIILLILRARISNPLHLSFLLKHFTPYSHSLRCLSLVQQVLIQSLNAFQTPPLCPSFFLCLPATLASPELLQLLYNGTVINIAELLNKATYSPTQHHQKSIPTSSPLLSCQGVVILSDSFKLPGSGVITDSIPRVPRPPGIQLRHTSTAPGSTPRSRSFEPSIAHCSATSILSLG
ncbi:hypothetical protein BDW69DRAFT_143267 [Aspergillus filifer]